MEQFIKRREALRKWVLMKADALKKLIADVSHRQTTLTRAIGEFDDKLQEFEAVQRSIEEQLIDSDAAYQAELEATQLFRDEVCVVRDEAAEILIRLHEKTSARSAVEDSRAAETTYYGPRTLQVKLPKLELPHFSGKITEFQCFWDNFEAHVDQSDLPVISKFSYLSSLLEGEAKRVICGLAITSANYPIAVEMIKQRFGDEERIISAHINALIMVSSPPSCRGAKYIPELWKMFDELNRNIKCLEAYKIDG